LVSESVQEFDSVGLNDRVNASGRSLQIGQDVFREEFDDIDKSVRRRDTLLNRRTSGSD
jgi:hypothetical protein